MEKLTELDFNPEIDFEATPIWVLDASHCVPPWTPFFAWYWGNYFYRGGSGAMETASLPYARATFFRLRNGGVYYGFSPVKDEEEVKQREANAERGFGWSSAEPTHGNHGILPSGRNTHSRSGSVLGCGTGRHGRSLHGERLRSTHRTGSLGGRGPGLLHLATGGANHSSSHGRIGLAVEETVPCGRALLGRRCGVCALVVS